MQQVGQDSQFWLGAPAAPVAKSSSRNAGSDAKVIRRAGWRPPRRLTRSRLIGSGVAVASLAGALVYTVLTDGGRNARESKPLLPNVEAAAAAVGLGVDQIAITGQRFTPDGDIFEALDLANGRSFASFDASAAKARIEDLPWVEHADLQRAFPGKLEIKIRERAPWAVWRRDTGDLLIDDTGRVLAAVKTGPASGLPLFVGEGAAKEAAALMSLLGRYPDVKQQLESAERVADRRWTLKLKDGNALVLPPEREAQALSLYASDRTVRSLTAGGGYIVDLRGVDKITLRKAQGNAAEPATAAAPPEAKS